MRYIAMNEIDNDVIIQGDDCITNLRDLYQALVDRNTTEIIIQKEFADKFFTYAALCDFMTQAEMIAPSVHLVVEGNFKDTAYDTAKDILRFQTPEELVYAVTRDPSRIISTIQTVCKAYLTAHEDSAAANNKIATMLAQLMDKDRDIENLKEKNADILENLNERTASLHALVSRMNYRYDKAVNVDESFILRENAYNHILYLKEITRVHFTDSLVYYVQEILKTLYGAPVRTVVIEPYYSYGNEYRYPGFIPTYKQLKYKGVYSGDLLMHGFQPRVMKDVLKDPNHVNYLIVLDRGGYKVPHIVGSNVTTIYCASEPSDAPNVDKDKLISYSADTLTIPFIEDFESMSNEIKIQKYSSMPITKTLIQYLED